MTTDQPLGKTGLGKIRGTKLGLETGFEAGLETGYGNWFKNLFGQFGKGQLIRTNVFVLVTPTLTITIS